MTGDRPPAAESLLDAYTPKKIAERVENAGVAKANLSLLPLFALAVLAGAFIAFGATFYLVVGFQFGLGPGAARLFGGIAFSLGLVLIVVGGAELFTGNNLIIMARCDGLIGTPALLRNWGVVYLGNFVGAVATAFMIFLSGILGTGDEELAGHARNIALAKTSLPLGEAFVRGILCNTLVCLAVWLSFAGHTVTEKAVAIVFPISAFVAMGLEHSVANMFFLPLGAFMGAPVDFGGFAGNLAVVTLGNLIGGSLLVGIVYWIVYRRPG